jgi:hypothetical protein
LRSKGAAAGILKHAIHRAQNAVLKAGDPKTLAEPL